MGGRKILWLLVFLLLCLSFFCGHQVLVAGLQPESEYRSPTQLQVVSKKNYHAPAPSSSRSSSNSNYWETDGKGRHSKEEVYKRCPKEEGMVQAKLPNGLFFGNGYWVQASEALPILPYSSLPPAAAAGAEIEPGPVRFVSLQLQPSAAGASGKGDGMVRGNLLLEIAAGMETLQRSQMLNASRDEREEGIRTQADYSSLTISLEGVMYKKQAEAEAAAAAEEEEVAEEMSFCMLGCRPLPHPSSSSSSSSSSSTATSSHEEDCNVMVRMQYPIKLSFTKRLIRAQITSLNNDEEEGDNNNNKNKNNKHFFHPVNVTALPSHTHAVPQPYQYTVGDVAAQVCHGASSADGVTAIVDRFQGPEYLQVLQSLLMQQLDVQPSLNCSESSEQFCDNMGPFGRFAPLPPPSPPDSAHHQQQQQEQEQERIRVSKRELIFHDFRFSGGLVPQYDAVALENNNNSGSDPGLAEGNASVVIRALQRPVRSPSFSYQDSWRFDSHALVAEGSWSNDTKQLCMVACRVDAAIVNVSGECHIRICIEIVVGLSLSRRSLISGTISSTRRRSEPGAFNPLLLSRAFQYMYFPPEVHGKLHYTFSHMEEATAFQGQFEPDSGQSSSSMMKMLAAFKYPALHGNNSRDYFALSDELSISSQLIARSGNQAAKKSSLKVQIEVLAIEDLITIRYGRADMMLSFSHSGDVSDTVPPHAKKKETPPDQTDSLKVAAQIMISEGWGYDQDPILEYAAEGWYEPKDGKMYMVGCRAVNANWTTLQENKRFLHGGRLDCDLTLLLEYPTTVARWLSRPTVKASIKSKRNADDPFYFTYASYETLPIMYTQQRKDMFFRKNLEGALSTGTLSAMFVCIVVQLVHISRNHDSAPFMSLGMLGVQAIGYMIPLITEAEALFARNQPPAWGSPADQWSQSIKFTIKLLTLLEFLLILRLIERVWKERVSQAQKAQFNVTEKKSLLPQESNVILVCGIVHLVSFLLILAAHDIKSRTLQSAGMTTERSGPELFPVNNPPSSTLQREAKEYWGLVEDLFLFPQAVGNAIWEVKGKPLHPVYYIGITVLRLLPHLYNRLHRPFLSPFDMNYAYANPNADFYTRNADIVIPLLAGLLVLLVYIQQKWKGWLVLPSRRLYSKLPVKNTETELVSTQIPGATMFSKAPEDHDQE